MSFDGFSVRLKNVLNEGIYTQKEAAEKIDISEHSFTKYLNGRIPQTEILYKIALLYDRPMEWFLTGKESDNDSINHFNDLTPEDKSELNMFLEFLRYKRDMKPVSNIDIKSSSISDHSDNILISREEPAFYLPILGDAAAGIPIEIIEIYQGDVKVNGRYDRSNSFIVRARGDSMIDASIKDGDLVIFKTQPTVENGEIALVSVNGEATIKYFYKHNGKCELRSANPTYPRMEYSAGDISILGKFVEVLEHK